MLELQSTTHGAMNLSICASVPEFPLERIHAAFLVEKKHMRYYYW